MPNPNQFSNQGEEPGFQPPRFQPIRPSDVAEVKKSYGITRGKFAKSESDKSIYDFSTKTVIDWWKRRKAEEAAEAAAGGAGGGSAPGGGGAGGGSAPGGGLGPVNPPRTQVGSGTGGVTRGVDPHITPRPPVGNTLPGGTGPGDPRPVIVRPPAPAPRPVAPPPPRRTIASESITAGVTRLAPPTPTVKAATKPIRRSILR